MLCLKLFRYKYNKMQFTKGSFIFKNCLLFDKYYKETAMKGLTRIKQINNLVIYQRDDGNYIVVNPKETNKKKSIVCFSPNLAEIEAFCKQRKELVILRGHNVHVGDIVVTCDKRQELGTIVTDSDDKTKWRFLPVKHGRYYSRELREITAKDVRPATFDEKVLYLKKD